MAKTKKEMLDDILTGILQIGQIKACSIVSSEGQIIDSRTPSDVDEGMFSALCSTLMESAEAASGQLKTGLVGQIAVKTEKGIIVLIPAGSKAIFTALTELDAQLGLILSEIESRAEQVNTILNNIK